MDKDRQIRFLYPPLFFVTFVLAALFADNPGAFKAWFKADNMAVKAITVVAGGGLAVLVMGLLIGTITTIFLRLAFFAAGGRRYEAVLSRAALEAIWSRLKIKESIEARAFGWRRQAFYAAVAFDHALVPKRIHLWLMRRWSAFNISANSVMAIILAFLSVCFLKIAPHPYLLLAMFAVGVLFLINAVIAWIETMAMLDFLSRCNLPKPKEDEAGSLAESTESTQADDQ